MHLRARKPIVEHAPQAFAPSRAKPRLAGEEAVATPSPSLQMQEALEAELSGGLALAPSRWSGRRSAAVIIGSSIALWVGVIMTVRASMTLLG